MTGNGPTPHGTTKIQAKETQAVAAQAAGDTAKAVAMMNQAVAVEDSIYALSQSPYPPIPAHELYGTMLLEMKRLALAREEFAETLKRTPGRPMAIYGLARCAEAQGDNQTAAREYADFLRVWRNADPDKSEVSVAKRFLETIQTAPPQ